VARCMFFFDGFNLYHSLVAESIVNKKRVQKYKNYKWLDLYKLAQLFVKKSDIITKVYYFSAYATWLPGPMKRHKMLVRALQHSGVKVVLGEFKEKDKFCNICKRWFKTKEEKQTDVNIALYLFREALLDRYDRSFLVTVDSDMLPAVELVKKTFPGKEIYLLTPVGRGSKALKNACDFRMRIKEKHLQSSQFPRVVTLVDGAILEKPKEW